MTVGRNIILTLTFELSKLRAAFLRSEELVAEAGEISETERKENVRRWKPLPSNG
jgi:hypothetical protein